MALVGVFVLSFLLVGISVALVSVVWSLLRGRKPAMFTVFQYFRQASQQFSRGVWTGPTPATNARQDDIVDVQAHEVPPPLIGRDGPLPK